jgi:acyl carrier protein
MDGNLATDFNGVRRAVAFEQTNMATTPTQRSMTLPEIYEAVSPVAKEVLAIPQFDGSITMCTTPSWDSLNHVQLLSAVERRFGIEIDANDAFKLTSADGLVQYVHKALQK